MTLMNIARIAKIVALLAFFLPWVAVSCQTVDVATASGLDLMQGRMTPNPQFEQDVKQQMNLAFGGLGDLNRNGDDSRINSQTDVPELGVNVFAVAAAFVILIGLGLSFAGKSRTAGHNVMVSSLLGLALVFGTVWWFKDSAMRDMEAKEGRSVRDAPMTQMDLAGAEMLNNMLQERFGYWIALMALAVAAGAGGLAMAGGVPARPMQQPAA